MSFNLKMSPFAALALALGARPGLAQEAPPPPPPTDEATGTPAEPAPSPPSPLEQKVKELEQREEALERRLALFEEAGRAAAATRARVSGFTYVNGDSWFRLGGILRLDGREFLDDPKGLGLRDTFVVRTARPVLEASLFGVADLRLVPDFANGTAALWDAYVDLRPFPWLGIRGGKWKTPLALERAQSETAVVFPERAFPTALAPNRDVGFALFGSLLGGAISYEGGIFNGATDNSLEDFDTNHAKDFAGRLFFLPFKARSSLLANLGVGFGASTGNARGTPATVTPRAAASVPVLPAYRSPGQQTFFSYLVNDTVADSTVLAKGRRTRWSPQAYYYAGPLGILGEYIQNSQSVMKGSNRATLKHTAWQVAATAVLGGHPTFQGVVLGGAPFDPKRGTLGAFELAVRYHELDLDDDAFPLYANPATSASRARAAGAVLNWHWNRNIKLALAIEQTRFKGGAANNGDRRTENVVFQRIQGWF